MTHMPLIIGHRGCKYSGIRENSKAAVERAVAEVADIVEIDVTYTKCDRFLAYHYIAPGPIAAYVRRQYLRLRADVESVESLVRSLDSRKPLYLDIKERLTRETMARLLGIVRAYHKNSLIIGSFHIGVLQYMQEWGQPCTINYHCYATSSAIATAAAVNANWINPMPFGIRRSFVDSAISRGLKFVPAGNENDKKQLLYADYGAYALSTFRPARLRSLLARHINSFSSEAT